MPSPPFAVILPAAGRSSRFGDPRLKKIEQPLGGRPVWTRAVEPFARRADVAQLLLAVSADDRPRFESTYHDAIQSFHIELLEGGAERVDTVARALERVDPACGFVAVHDAARPLVSSNLIDAVFAAARAHGAALPGRPIAETIKRVGPEGTTLETVPRAGLFTVQTPQAFRLDLLRWAHAHRANLTAAITDDAQLVEALGHPCRIVEGPPFNLAEALLRAGLGGEPDPS